nr:phosphatidylinositol 4-phosphate 5-kinase 8 isoform X2 [Arachis hypogaea]
MKGNYKWLDGTIYDGDFESEKMTGKGLIRWPSGSNYEGEFSGGFLHGNGTLTSSSGCTYRGGWRMNAQHGIGKKEYSNSDVYDGLWKEGVQEGCGKYSWNNGNTYIGNWKNGKIEGRGVMKWTNGDTFDGFWMNGVRHGSGVYRFADGSVYIGTWNNGLRDGKGTFYPAGTKLPSLKNLCTSLETEHFIASKSKPVKRSLSENIPVVSRLSSRPKSQRTLSLSTTTEWTLQDQSDLVYEREYAQGVLIMERIRDCSVSSVKNKSQNNKFSVNHVEKSSYMDIFKAHRGYFLNLNLQLGIRYTVGKITPVPAREVRSSDFGDRARIRMFFPRDGSKLTPPHCSIDFYWKDYCPMVFRLRVQLGVNMPAQANRKVEEDHSSNNNNNNKKKKKKKVEGRDDDDEEEAELFEVYDVVLYMGIIDILQAYNLRKRVENAYKSIKFDPLTISVVQPNLYAQRFINFSQNKVFPQTPC